MVTDCFTASNTFKCSLHKNASSGKAAGYVIAPSHVSFSVLPVAAPSASKSKDMIVLEILFHLDCLFALFDLPSDNSGVHVSKLAAVALVKHKNNMLVRDRVVRIFRNEHIQFLNGRYDNSGGAVLKLSLQNSGTLVSVGSTFFKAVIFLNGLIVQVLTINHKQNLCPTALVCIVW